MYVWITRPNGITFGLTRRRHGLLRDSTHGSGVRESRLLAHSDAGVHHLRLSRGLVLGRWRSHAHPACHVLLLLHYLQKWNKESINLISRASNQHLQIREGITRATDFLRKSVRRGRSDVADREEDADERARESIRENRCAANCYVPISRSVRRGALLRSFAESRESRRALLA